MADKKPVKKTTGDYYGAESITVLEGLEPVRKRPGMYIGSTSATGLHHLIWEVVDNGIDEAMAGHADTIKVTLLDNGLVEVFDNGRGIPVGMHKITKVSALETVLTKLHAGGKFGEGGGYKVSGGLHGVGVSVVNALSEYLKAEVFRDGKTYVQEYSRGDPKGPVKAVGKADKTGTRITFKPDKQIFGDKFEFNLQTIIGRFRQQAYLTKGVTISIVEEKTGEKYKFYFEGGISSYVHHLNKNRDSISGVIAVEKDMPEGNIEIALQYTQAFQENIFTFANNIHTPEGGMHLTGFRSALTSTINNYARKNGLLKEKDENLSSDDVREGLTAVISVKLRDPQFEGQTKSKLGNPEMRTAVETVFNDFFPQFLEENPKK